MVVVMASRRNLAVLLLALVGLVGLIAAFAFYIQAIRPPRQFRIAAGAIDGVYYAGAQQIRDEVAKRGFIARVLETGGSTENLGLLKTGRAEIGIIQGGVATFTDTTGLTTLSMLGYEPIWLFYRKDRFSPEFRTSGTAGLEELRGKRVNLGATGSGAQLLGQEILELIGITPDDFTLLEEGMTTSAQMLQDGELDAALFITPVRNPIIANLARDPQLELRHSVDGAALSRQVQALNDITLQSGVLDIANRLPAEDVPLLGLRIALVGRQGIHPDLVRLVVSTLPTVPMIRAPAAVGQRFEFPNLNNPEIPANPDALQFYMEGETPFERFLPFDIASPLARFYLLLLPLAVLALPAWSLMKFVYGWFMKSRLLNWYPVITAIDRKIDQYNLEQVDEQIAYLAQIDAEISRRANVTKGYQPAYLDLRYHISFVTGRLQEQRARLLALQGGTASGTISGENPSAQPTWEHKQDQAEQQSGLQGVH
jgi:TRAP transporter TAXI family solute receptor